MRATAGVAGWLALASLVACGGGGGSAKDGGAGTVPFALDRDTTQNVIACPSPPRHDAKFTTITGGGHGIWDPIYDLSGGSGDIYAWVLANPKS